MKRQGTIWFAAIIGLAVTVPLMLGLETLLRAFLLPPEIEEVRMFWRPGATAFCWGLLPVAFIADAGAFLLQRRFSRRATSMAASEKKKRWKKFEGLMISASVAQIPGLMAVIAVMLGAKNEAAIAVIGASSMGVLALGLLIPQLNPTKGVTSPYDTGENNERH